MTITRWPGAVVVERDAVVERADLVYELDGAFVPFYVARLQHARPVRLVVADVKIGARGESPVLAHVREQLAAYLPGPMRVEIDAIARQCTREAYELRWQVFLAAVGRR